MPGILTLQHPVDEMPEPKPKPKKRMAALIMIMTIGAIVAHAPLAGHFIPNPGWIL